MTHFGSRSIVTYKKRMDPVTRADRASEKAILKHLLDRCPDHGVLSEESGSVKTGTVRWIIDPLDGTTNFVHHIAHFCVSIAAEDQAGLLAAAIFDPTRNELFSAARGCGATLNGRPITVNATPSFSRSLLATGLPSNIARAPWAPLACHNALAVRVQNVINSGSSALDLAYVALGRLDGFWHFQLEPWDVAAGILLVEEAGGIVEFLHGTSLKTDAVDLIACSGSIARELRAAIVRASRMRH
jgi:myo-inositol-1(or 4)-monophosphatase